MLTGNILLTFILKLVESFKPLGKDGDVLIDSGLCFKEDVLAVRLFLDYDITDIGFDIVTTYNKLKYYNENLNID